MNRGIAYIQVYFLHFLLGFLLCLFTYSHTSAQNLVPNPSFEVDDFCDCAIGGQMPCEPWVGLNTCDYFHTCSPITCGVPTNFAGYQPSHGGEAYMGGYQRNNAGILEWPQVQLVEPLIAGQCYEVSYYVSLNNEGCGINHLGALFTNDPILWPTGMTPQIDGGAQYFSDTLDWMNIYGTFIALGGEEYLTLGNFIPNSETQVDPLCLDPTPIAYYYFDDVLVQETETFPIDVDLGGPYEDCFYVVLDPGLSGVEYSWSDGSTDPTLLVTTSGTYSLVVSAPGCMGGVATTEVTILDSPGVSLSPDVTICNGDSYTISLDDAAGEYTWNTGSNEAEISITTAGIYSVTLDDGCDITWDQIEVSIVEYPLFTLGDDMPLCAGAALEFQFDPSLGAFQWQDNSNSSSYTIDEPGMYALTISNACGTESDELEITLIDFPEFTLGPDTVLCQGDDLLMNFEEITGEFLWQDGNTNSIYTISETGLYELTISNICGIETDDFFVTGINTPVVDLGFSLHLCPGETEVIDGGEHYGNYTWQDGSTDHQYEVTVQGIYSLTVTNECGSHSDDVVVNYEPDIMPPDLGPDITICTGEEFVLEIDQPNGYIEWSDFSTENTLVVTTSGTYFVEIFTLCESYSDTIEVSVHNTPPTIDLPDDFSLCEGQYVILESGIVNGSYLWNDGTQLPELNVTSPGTYSLTITTSCGTDSDSVTILAGGLAPAVSLGSDTSICAGSSLILTPSFSNVTSWAWMDGSETPVFVATSPGTVFIEANNDCGFAYDTVMIDLLPDVPVLELGSDTAMCPGETITFSINLADVNIHWHDGSIGSDLTLTDSAVVIASISNLCSESSDTLNLGLFAGIPLLDLGPDQSLCPGELITISPGIDDVDYLWHDGSAGNEFQTTQEGIIILTISNECGSAIDTLEVNESTEGPQLDLGPDLKACEGEIVVIGTSISGVNYVWQDGSTDDEYIAVTTGMYILTINNACGSDTDTVEVEISGKPPKTFLGEDTTLCEGATLLLSADSDPATSSIWQDGSTADKFEVTISGTYYLTESNECGSDLDTIQVQISGLPPATSLGADTMLCEGSILVLNADMDPSTSSLWQDGSTWDEFNVSTTGTYILIESNACGIDSDTIEIVMNGFPPIVDLGKDTSLCDGESLVLISDADLTTYVIWQDGTTGLMYLVTAPGIYILSEINHCGQAEDSIVISFVDSPVPFDLGPDTVLCPGESFTLNAPATSFEILWQDGSRLPFIVADEALTYSLRLSNACGVEVDSISVTIDNRTPFFDLEDQLPWCEGDTIMLDAIQSFPVMYQWNTGEITPAIHVTYPGYYNVDVVTPCITASHETFVEESENCVPVPEFYIPNIMSPNGDGINDYFSFWTLDNVEIVSTKGNIYDRWGNQIFASTDIPFIWDGKFKDELMPPGVYVFAVKVNFKVENKLFEEVFSGDITLIR